MGCPGIFAIPRMVIGGWPGLKIGTRIVSSTVSIQKVAVIRVVCAFGLLGGVFLSPSKNAMLSVPPPKIGATGLVAMDIAVVAMIFCPLMWLRRTVFGSSRMACVIVPALM